MPTTSILIGVFCFSNFKYNFILGAVASIVVGLITLLAIEVKKKLGPYSRNGLPLCLSLVWILFTLPIFALLPSLAYLMPGSLKSEEVLGTGSILLLMLILLIGTTILSFVLNKVFRKIQRELKIKLVTNELKKDLGELAVKGEIAPLRLCI